MNTANLVKAAAGLRALFDEEVIPKGFRYERQTFEERCRAWVLRSAEELEKEIEAFEDQNKVGNDNKSVAAWSLVGRSKFFLATLKRDCDGTLTSWKEARDALAEFLADEINDAEEWKREVEAMDEQAFMAEFGPQPVEDGGGRGD